jgi:hypothetical protein
MIRRSYLIIGCGRFGSRAVREILTRNPLSEITVVDKSSKALRKVHTLPVHRIISDGLTHLDRFLSEGLSADYVIPAVPFHLAFEFLLLRLKAFGARRGKVPLLPALPNPMRGTTGDLYTSFADFLCPEDCPEPARHCTITNKRRSKPLYTRLAELHGPFGSRVFRSEQICPGVGGFQLQALGDLLQEIENEIPSRRIGLTLISTSCRCHGVTSALTWKRRDQRVSTDGWS